MKAIVAAWGVAASIGLVLVVWVILTLAMVAAARVIFFVCDHVMGCCPRWCGNRRGHRLGRLLAASGKAVRL